MRGETSEAFRRRMEAKAARNRYFIGLEEAAAVATLQARKDRKNQNDVQDTDLSPEVAVVTEAERKYAVQAARRGKRMMMADHSPARKVRERKPRKPTPYRPVAPEDRVRIIPPKNCIECGRTMRSRAAGSTGEVRHYRNGRCSSCVTGGRPRGARFPRPCTGCGRTLRASGTTAAKFPGTIQAYRDGMCHACWLDATGNRKRSRLNHELPVLRPCAGTCGKMTRPGKMAKSAAPETITRTRNGMCASCAKAADRG